MTVWEAFETTEILNQAGAGTRERLAACSVLKRREKGNHIVLERDEVSCLYFLVDGLASIYKINSLGEKKVIFVYGNGSALNIEALQAFPSPINCELREDSVILCVPIEAFWHEMERDACLMRAAVNGMALKIRRLYRQMKNTTNALSGEKRLAAKLYKLARDYGEERENGILINMNLSITYLADMLGSKRETVSRQAKRLCELDLIRLEKNRVTVPNLENLSKYFKMP